VATVLWLSEIEPGQRALVGGKGLSLARLAESGFRVPEAFVITVETTESIAAASRFPAGIRRDLLAALARLSPAGEAVAVRSSALAEDGEAASFAGQHDTILGVTGEKAFVAAVKKCLASLHSEAAVAYRERHGGDHAGARMAIVVQHMVQAELSGVAFSIDPLTGDPGRVVVEAVAGVGEALVSGTAEADRMALAREGLAVVEEHHPGTPVLTPEIARQVAEAALLAEERFGAPQDIEFAIEGGVLWMLQSRPITTAGAMLPGGGWMNEFDTPTTDDDLWTSANVQEVLPGILTPMTMSTFTKYARRGYIEGYQRLKVLDKDEFPEFAGMFYNRAFLHVGATRMIADRVIGASADSVEHRFLGGELKVEGRREHSLRLWRIRMRSIIPMLRMMRGIEKAARRIDRETRAMERRVRADDVAQLSNAELEARRTMIAEFVTGTFQVHLQATGMAGQGFETTSKTVRPVLGDETEGTLPALFSGMRGVESAQIGLDLWELSRVAVREGLTDAIRAEGFDPRAEGLPAAWKARFGAFMERHGHRGLNEMEPAAPTWRTDPRPIVAIVAAYLDLPEDRSPPVILTRQEQERLRLTTEVEARMNPLKRRYFRWGLKQAQLWVSLREFTKSVIVRGTRLVDYYAPEVGRRLVATGLVADPADLFFLTTDEVSDALLGKVSGPYHDRVARRRREYERNRHVELPERFRGHPAPLEPDLSHHAGDVLTGTPVSPGLVTGRARVIHDPRTDDPIQPGEILVAPVTDAGWTPLFALASGLVVDMGSALSHGSTVAREYGLPAVVNVRRGTHSIRTGDLVAVNGTRGTVTILEEGSP
jgi:pyruvate,water dikinase